MKKRNNNAWLKAFMKEYNLSRLEVASAVHVHKSTVDRWLVPKTVKGKKNPTYRPMPDMALELLHCKERAGEFDTE